MELALRIVAALCVSCVSASHADDFDVSAANLIPVLRESPGANKQDEALRPFGKIRMTLADGRDVQFEASWFQYLGDMHVRLVFDGRERVQSAIPEDLERLKLTPQQALDTALANLRRRYGRPEVVPYSGGLKQLRAEAPGLVSSYFLDREFWRAQLLEHPAGIVATVPARGGIVFGPANDELAVTSLRFSAAALYAASGGTRLSSALYLFSGGQWSVYQPPQTTVAAHR